MLIVTRNSYNKQVVSLLSGLIAPVATAATSVTGTSFVANWNAYDGATTYYLDVSTSPTFATFVLQNQAVLAPTTSYIVTGLTSCTTYYYRVRAEGNKPTISIAPTLSPSGTQGIGTLITCATGTWNNQGSTFNYQWKRNGVSISGATSSTYTLQAIDNGTVTTCEVQNQNAFGKSPYVVTSNSASAVDPDAQAFITAASITDPTQQSAINQLVVDLKGYNIWTKMKAVYPFVGGSATSHSYNLRNTAQFQITWVGGVTHSANGVQYNGTNSYGNTNFNCNTNTTITNNCVGAYSRTNEISTGVSWGGSNNSFQGLQLYVKFTDNSTYYSANDFISTGGGIGLIVPDTRGLFIVNRESLTSKRLYRNGTSVTSSNPGGNDGVLNGNLFIGARNLNGTADSYDNKQYAFHFVSDTLTAAEVGNLTTAVQTFQTTLGRSVGPQTVSDPNAQAFVTAADIQDQVQATAINNLVIGMKAQSLWTKMKAVYPFVGGTASSHKFNLINPVDSDAAFRLVFNGGITHNSNGITGNGSNSYVNTFFNTNNEFTISSAHIGVYDRSNTIGSGNYTIGNLTSGNAVWLLYANDTQWGYLGGINNVVSNGSINIQGHRIVTRTANNLMRGFRNAVQVGVDVTATITSYTNLNLFLLSTNFNGSPFTYSDHNLAFAHIGNGLTNTDVSNLYTLVQAFQTTLGRQV